MSTDKIILILYLNWHDIRT